MDVDGYLPSAQVAVPPKVGRKSSCRVELQSTAFAPEVKQKNAETSRRITLVSQVVEDRISLFLV